MAKSKKRALLLSRGDINKAAERFMKFEAEEGRSITMVEGKIKDDFCFYTQRFTEGREKGQELQSKKPLGIIDIDMREAAADLNVHLAYKDDIFSHAKIKISDIDDYHSHELTLLYNVTGFKIYGDEGEESMELIGTKKLSSNERMDLKTPRIAMDSASSYPWKDQLKSAMDKWRLETALYRYGKYTVPENEEDDRDDEKQTKIQFLATTEVLADEDVNMEEGKV